MSEPRRYEASMSIDNADDIRVSALITMSVGDWKRIRQQIKDGDRQSFPLFKFEEMITAIVEKVFKHIEEDQSVKS